MLHGVPIKHLILSPPLHIHLPKVFRSISTIDRHYQSNELLDTFDHLIRQCASIQQCQQIHTQIHVTKTQSSSFLIGKLISTYARFGYLDDANKAFEKAPAECLSDLLIWNSILRANIKHGQCEKALRVYLWMRKVRVRPDQYTLPLVARVCASLGDSKVANNVHCHVVHMGLHRNFYVVNELMNMYGKLGNMGDARRMFNTMVVKSHMSWNIMISGYALNYDCDNAFELFCKMEMEDFGPNYVTWISLLSSHARCGRHKETLHLYNLMRRSKIGTSAEALAVVISVCADCDERDKGQVSHGDVIKRGFEKYIFVINSLISLYGKQGLVSDAKHLFSEMENRNRVSWNALISSFAECGLCDEAFAIFSQLENSNEYPVVRPDVISWSAVIGGFSSKGNAENCFKLFRRMQFSEVLANFVTIASVLSVCAELSCLRFGREIHGHVTKSLIDGNIFVGNGLINMYTKCGSLNEAYSVFVRIGNKDIITWNSMISGYKMHGHAFDALRTFELMISSGYKPDGVTFVALLSACSHVGLVKKGKKLFDQMKRVFILEPQLEHYACMIDLLGRAGLLQEASDLVNAMPMEPNAHVWGSLLNSCRMHKNTDFAKFILSRIFSLDSDTTGSYMLLSNIYAIAGRWEDSASVRVSAKTKGLKKIPGQSWIEVKKKVYMFSSGISLQTEMKDIFQTVKYLGHQIEIGFLPEMNFKLQELDE